MTETSTIDYSPPCPGCGGWKVQTNKDGINVLCPVCNGTGREPNSYKQEYICHS